MTDAEREALVERIKQAVTKEQGCGDEYAFCKRWPEDCMCRHIARAALAVAEPAIRADEREGCAALVETSIYIMSGSHPARLEYSPKRAKSDTHHATIAAAIRARGAA